MSKRRKKRMNPMLKLWLWKLADILVTFAPIIAVIYIHRAQYFATKAAGRSLTCGGVMAVVLVALAAFGKGAKIFGSGVTVTGIIFVMAYLLEPIILNLQLLSGMLFLGFAVSRIFIAPLIKRAERQVNAKENAKAVKEAMNG